MVEINSSAQGTIEYLVILAIIVVISLVVVSLLTISVGSPSTQISTTTDKIGNLTSGGISVVEAVTDPSGDSIIRFQNNSGENITLTKITYSGIENTYSQTIPQGEKVSLEMDSMDLECPCQTGQAKVSCDYTITFVSSSGLTKTLTKTTKVECVLNVSPVGTVVSPITTAGILDCWNENSSPHPVCTLSDLNRMREQLDWSYELKADINAYPTRTWNSGAGFSPIGLGSSFTGNFNGNNRNISGIYINLPNTDYVGLFSKTDNSQLTNFGLVDLNIIGRGWVGAYAGQASSSLISNSYSTGNLTGGEGIVGGLFGLFDYGTLSNSYSTVSVNGGSSVGGLVGYLWVSEITNSYSIGKVSAATNGVGGIVGSAGASTISNSFSTGEITGDDFFGGLGGYLDFESPSTVSSSYWDTTLSGQSNCYYTGSDGCTSTDGNVNAYYGAEGVSKLNNTSNWVAREGNYPILSWQ
ncbi:MAG: GLUG motif-containing protein [archaeon]|jgi:hypothetical protein